MKSTTISRPRASSPPAFFNKHVHPFWRGDTVVVEDLARVEAVIRETVDAAAPRLREALGDYTARQGKMLRPAFVTIAARLRRSGPGKFLHRRHGSFGARAALPEKMYRIAAAIEVLHLATLVHDDIVDDADTRRGGPTLHRLYGSRDAALLGDFLFSTCFSLVAEHGTMANARVLASGVARICEAEILESEQPEPEEVTLRGYLRRIAGKTALLFALSFHVGASEHEASVVDVRRLRRIGYDIGMGFQIIDDILDLTGDRRRLGKPAGNDLRGGILTAPVIFGLRSDNGSLREMLGEREPDVEAVASLLRERGAIARARELARRYTDRALRECEGLPAGDVRDTLVRAVRRLLERDY